MNRNLLWVLLLMTATPLFAQQRADDRRNDQPRGDQAQNNQAQNADEPLDVSLSGAEVQVEVVGDAIIITAQDGDLTVVEELANRLDRDIPPLDFRVIRLQNKNAQDVATAVQQAMEKLLPRDPRPEETVTVTTISNNVLLMTGPEGRLKDAERMVEFLDAVEPSLPEVEMLKYELSNIKAAEAKTKLQELINALRARQGEDPASEINITAIDASNSLLVMAPKTEHEKIRQLIAEVDIAPVQGFGDLQLVYFPLVNSDVTKLSEVLNDLLTSAESAEDVTETIRRLRMVKSDLEGNLQELPPINLERQIKLIPDEDSQALICATASENIEPLRELIILLDGVPLAVEQGLRVFPLAHADATSVKELLDEMFESGKTLPRSAPGTEASDAVPTNAIGKSLVYNIGITADARTNTLIVAGRQEQLLMVEGILQKLDVEAMEVKHPLQLIQLANSDATRVGNIIEELWDKRIEVMEQTNLGEAAIARERIFLTVDLRSNALIVAAGEANLTEIRRICATLDAAPDRFNDQIRILNCTNTSAADLKIKIDELWQRKAELRGEAEQPQDAPVLVADQRSNSLVIASSPEDFAEIKRLVDQLEAQPLAPIAEIRLITLVNNDASQIGEMLRQLFEERMQQRLVSGQEESPTDRVAVAIEPATNTILVASSRENFDEMMRIIKVVDVEPDLQGVVRIFPLNNAQADTVAQRIQDLFDQGLYTGIVGSDNQIAEQRQKVALVADERSNAIIASASKTNLTIIEKLIGQMDGDEPPMLNADTRLFRLNFADAVKLAAMLDQLFEGMASGADSEFEAPTLVPEPTSNTLIATGSRDAIKRATELVSSLDVEPQYKTAIRVYPLKHASAARLTVKMQEIFDTRQEGADTERTPVVLMPEESTNSIICSASEEDHRLTQHLVGLLDVPSTISRQVQIFPLSAAKAEPTADLLEQLFESQADTGGSGGGRADVLAVQPDRRTNSLIVWAAQSEMDNIASVIKKLDTSRPGPEMMVRVITLRRALAEELAETLLNTINGEDGGTGDDAEAVVLNFDEHQPDGTVVNRKLLRQDINIQPDPRTNSLFVMAPAGSMEMLEGLIRSIDRIPPTVAEIRMFPLLNADAEEIVAVLTELFEQQQDEGPETQLQVGDAAGGGDSTVPGQLLRFTANRRTNTVIAAGSQTDLDMIESLIRNMDGQDNEDRARLVFEPLYVPSTDVATALRDFLQEEDELYSELDDTSSILSRAERHVTVVADEDSNSLLIGGSERYLPRTMEMLRSLDRPPPQVMIQVLIAEVTLDDSVELGMEFALQDLLFSENAVVGPNGVVRGNNFDFVGGTDVGAAGAAGSFGGFSFSITGEDFNFLLRALQSDGSLEVLSRPTILVQNNQEANITIGDEVPFLRSSNVSDSGQVNSNVEYEDVGIILDVTPHINPDGYVLLEVAPEISALNPGSNVQISEGLTAPTFTNRRAETVVTVKDGETVVIGGLIQTQEDIRETKVPVLGDVPGVGALFRATSNTRRRTELLIVLTVDVVRDEFEAYRTSVKMRDQSGFMPESIKRSPLMQGLRILPGDDQPDYFDDPRFRRIDRKPQAPNRPQYNAPARETYGPPSPRTASHLTDGSAERYGPPPVATTRSTTRR